MSVLSHSDGSLAVAVAVPVPPGQGTHHRIGTYTEGASDSDGISPTNTRSPPSAGTVYYHSPPAGSIATAFHGVPVKTEELNGGENDDAAGSGSGDVNGEPARKKQKRNKPTLSCFECVERKTKVT
jgi:hypothetical protein